MEILKQLTLLSNLDEGQKSLLISKANIKSWGKGQDIVEYGTKVQDIHVVIDGRVKLYRTNEDGQDIVIQILDANDWFFNAAAFTGIYAPSSVGAIEDSTVAIIPSSVIRELVCTNTAFANNIFGHVAKDFEELTTKVFDMVLKTPHQRVCYFLLKESIKQGVDKTEFQLPYKKSLIANELGMTAETFSRVLTKMKDLGVKVEKNKVILPRVGTLCESCGLDLARECPSYDSKVCPTVETSK